MLLSKLKKLSKLEQYNQYYDWFISKELEWQQIKELTKDTRKWGSIQKHFRRLAESIGKPYKRNMLDHPTADIKKLKKK